MQSRQYYIYLMTNQHNTVLYVGVTNDLARRVHEHKNHLAGFTKKYNLDKLVWFEATEDVTSAIAREKQIKGGSRAKKVELINRMNPNLDDLSERLL